MQTISRSLSNFPASRNGFSFLIEEDLNDTSLIMVLAEKYHSFYRDRNKNLEAGLCYL